jgi:hypothetical protein
MGIIDSKSRIVDSILTPIGRRQLFDGGLRIKYASFSDGDISYEYDLDSENENRILFESNGLPHDQVTIESDEDGRISGFSDYFGDYDILVRDGQFIQTVVNSSNSDKLYNTNIFSGSNLQEKATDYIDSIVRNLQLNRIISTKDNLFDDIEFTLSTNSVNYTLTKKNVDKQSFLRKDEQLKPVYNDIRFSSIENFMFLPPVNKSQNDSADSIVLSDYKAQNPNKKLTYSSLVKQHSNLHPSLKKTILIDETSRENNCFFQAFEITNNCVNKLDIIDFGILQNDSRNPITLDIGSYIRVFFLGKFIKKDDGSFTFVHIFSLIFG